MYLSGLRPSKAGKGGPTATTLVHGMKETQCYSQVDRYQDLAVGLSVGQERVLLSMSRQRHLGRSLPVGTSLLC